MCTHPAALSSSDNVSSLEEINLLSSKVSRCGRERAMFKTSCLQGFLVSSRNTADARITFEYLLWF